MHLETDLQISFFVNVDTLLVMFILLLRTITGKVLPSVFPTCVFHEEDGAEYGWFSSVAALDFFLVTSDGKDTLFYRNLFL